MITATALSTQSDAVDPDEDRLGGVASGRFASVLLLVRALIDFGRQMLATVQQGSDRSGLTDIKLRFRTLDLSAIVARVTRALALAAGLETRLEKLAAREPVDDESGAPSERAPRARAAKVANGGLPSAAAIAQRLREKPIGVVLEEICRALGIVPRDPLWRKAFLPILKHGGSCPFHPTKSPTKVGRPIRRC